jgi:hypothetical protein
VQQSISPSIQAPSPDGATAHQHQIPISSAELRETDFPKFDLSALEAMSESDRRAHADSMELPALGRFIRPALTGVKRLVEAYRPYILRFMRRTAHQGQQNVLTNAKGEPADRDEVVRELLGVGVRRINQLLATTDPKAPKPKPSLTPTQDAVVQALVGQGYKKKDAVAMVKAAEGNDFDSLFRSALSRRGGKAGMTTAGAENPDADGNPERVVNASGPEPAPKGTLDDDKARPDSAKATDELKAALESEPDSDVASKLLTHHIQTVAEQFANERIQIMHVSLRVEFAGRNRRIMPGDFLEILEALPSGSSTSSLGKCTRIGGDGESMVIDWHDTLGQWCSEHGIGGEGENSYRVITEARAHEIAPGAFAVSVGAKKKLDALETTMAIGGMPSFEVKKLIAAPKSHCYDMNALKVAFSATLAAEASR